MQNAYNKYDYRFWRCKTNGFAGIYPVDTEDYEDLRASGKITIERCFACVLQSSAALGFGLLYFLGMCTWIIQERLSEFDMVITTVPKTFRT
jgi:translation elongation factor EF-4